MALRLGDAESDGHDIKKQGIGRVLRHTLEIIPDMEMQLIGAGPEVRSMHEGLSGPPVGIRTDSRHDLAITVIETKELDEHIRGRSSLHRIEDMSR
jgi:hypothetical protein